MAAGTKGLWVGPMPVHDFLDEYVPLKPNAKPSPQLPDLFKTIPAGKGQESEKYSYFMELVAEHKLVPGFKIADTSNHPDNNSTGNAIRPDPTMYHDSLDMTEKYTKFGKLEMHFEFKPTDDYDDPPTDITLEQRRSWVFGTIRAAGAG